MHPQMTNALKIIKAHRRQCKSLLLVTKQQTAKAIFPLVLCKLRRGQLVTGTYITLLLQ